MNERWIDRIVSKCLFVRVEQTGVTAEDITVLTLICYPLSRTSLPVATALPGALVTIPIILFFSIFYIPREYIYRESKNNNIIITSVSETIRKPSLVKAQTALRKKIKYGGKMIFNMADGILTPCNVACGSRIMTVNSPSGSRPTLQRETWLWDDMSLNSPGGSTLQCDT